MYTAIIKSTNIIYKYQYVMGYCDVCKEWDVPVKETDYYDGPLYSCIYCVLAKGKQDVI